MEILKLREKNSKKIVFFEEYLNNEGDWVTADSSSDEYEIVRQLDYESPTYIFYIVESDNENHLIYRCNQ